MSWLRRLFRNEPAQARQSKERELDALEKQSEHTLDRADHVLTEQRKLAQSLRNTVRAMRAGKR